MQRLTAMGGKHAVVVSATRAESDPARRLYEAVGFRRVLQFEDWERTLL
jgi:ribosomal protein S18 acetylase RimI-like enzyme